MALGLDTPGPSSRAFIRLTRGAASVGRDRDHDGSLPGINVVVCSAHVLTGVGHGHLVQPQVGAVGLVSGGKAAPTLVPRDGGLGLPSDHTVQIQGLPFNH